MTLFAVANCSGINNLIGPVTLDGGNAIDVATDSGTNTITVALDGGLTNLSDILFAGLADGDFIRYESSSAKWKNYTAAALGFVPYIGATADVDLGIYGLTADLLTSGRLKAESTAGLNIYAANNTTQIANFGSANTANVTWYGAHNFNAATANGVAYFGSSKTLTSDANLVYTPVNGRFYMLRPSEPGSLYFIDLGSGYTQFITSYGSLTTKTTFCNNVSIQEDFQLAASSVGASIILAAALMTMGTTSATDLRFIRGSTERLRCNASGVLIPSAQNLTVGLAASGTKKFTVSDQTAALNDVIQIQGNYAADGYGSAITFTDSTPTTLAKINSIRESNNNIGLSTSVYSSGTLRTATLSSSDGSFRTFGAAGTASFFANSGEHLFYTAGTPYIRFVEAFNDAYMQTYTLNSALYLTGAAGATMATCKIDASATYITGVLGVATTVATNILTIGDQNAALGEAIRVNGNSTQNYMSFYNNTARQGYIGTYASGIGFVVSGDSGGLFLQSSSTSILALNDFFTWGCNGIFGYQNGVSGGVFAAKPSVYGAASLQGVTSGFAPTTLALNPAAGYVCFGNVGLTSSTAKLQITGNIEHAWDSVSHYVRYQPAPSSYYGGWDWDASGRDLSLVAVGADGDPSIFFKTGTTATTRMWITSAGNVGIGVSPVAKFQVNASVGSPSSYANYGLLMYDGGAASSSYGLGIAGSTIWQNSAAFHAWYTSGVEQMRLWFGNLGINCTAPLGRLTICGGTADNHSIEIGYSGGLTANYMESINRNGGASVDFVYYMGGASLHRFYTSNLQRLYIGAGLVVGAPTGGDKGAGTINIAGDIYKNNTAYTNPQWALKHYYTGSVDKTGPYAPPFEYKGLMSLDQHRRFTAANYDLPLMTMEPDAGIIGRGDLVLASLEQAYLYIYQLHDRILELEKNAKNDNNIAKKMVA